MLTLASCYLMWMVTYMAQLHPLVGACTQIGFIDAQLILVVSSDSVTEARALNAVVCGPAVVTALRGRC